MSKETPEKKDFFWYLGDEIREKALKRIQDILDDPHSSDRAIGIAIRNLIQLNGQDIHLVKDGEQEGPLEIRIVEDGGS